MVDDYDGGENERKYQAGRAIEALVMMRALLDLSIRLTRVTYPDQWSVQKVLVSFPGRGVVDVQVDTKHAGLRTAAKYWHRARFSNRKA